MISLAVNLLPFPVGVVTCKQKFQNRLGMAADPRGVDNMPRALVLGGCGFIGRNLVHYLVKNDLVSNARIVDKVPPQTAWLNSIHQKTFNNPIVEFKSANLLNPASVTAAFDTDDGIGWDVVVNCAGETKLGQAESVLREGIYKLSLLCAMEAAKHKVGHFIEISDGHMYSSDKTAFKEDSRAEPWTMTAKFKSQVEEELTNVENLKYTILRPGIVYGLGDRNGLASRLVIGAVYQHLGEMMKLLWGKDLRMNTVHVEDVCRAVWFVAFKDTTARQVYHLVDESNSTQGTISSLVSDLFNINHDYWGNTLSTICKADMEALVEQVNDKHLGPWAEACTKSGIENTPLTPYLDTEQLLNKHLYLDGTKLRKMGFTYTFPQVTRERLKEVVDDYVSLNMFPQSFIL